MRATSKNHLTVTKNDEKYKKRRIKIMETKTSKDKKWRRIKSNIKHQMQKEKEKEKEKEKKEEKKREKKRPGARGKREIMTAEIMKWCDT